MSDWDSYPEDYRENEVNHIVRSVNAGNSVSIIGLSGSGKSNLLGYLYHRVNQRTESNIFHFVDCNKLIDPSPGGFYRLLNDSARTKQRISESLRSDYEELAKLEELFHTSINNDQRLCFLLDRFEVIVNSSRFQEIAGNLRALRDDYKYKLTYLTATRRPIDETTEIAELFYGNQLWIGVLSNSDALWSANRDARRLSNDPESWGTSVLAELVELSGGYPSLLRACCEAYYAGIPLELETLIEYPGVVKRIEEFWADAPTERMLELSGLHNNPLLTSRQHIAHTLGSLHDTSSLTAKEHKLLEYLMSHEGEVCEKDHLVQAVWSEDIIYEQGIRDDSLAQLIRRLRKKIEPNPSQPKYIQTIPGRGYLFQGK